MLTRELAEQADVVVTMGCGESVPISPASATSTGTSKTPKGRPPDEVRATRDDIARRVEALVAELDRPARATVPA
jgi:arsenate reductase (thioredoxin)